MKNYSSSIFSAKIMLVIFFKSHFKFGSLNVFCASVPQKQEKPTPVKIAIPKRYFEKLKVVLCLMVCLLIFYWYVGTIHIKNEAALFFFHSPSLLIILTTWLYGHKFFKLMFWRFWVFFPNRCFFFLVYLSFRRLKCSLFYFRGTHPLPPRPEDQTPPSWARKDEWDEDEIFEASKPHLPPKFKKLLQDISMVEGDKTYMECTVFPAGDPTMVRKILFFQNCD